MEPVELLPDTWHFSLNKFEDQRGSFVKTFTRSMLAGHGLAAEFAEEFYSVSRKNVIRGMHFQLPPHDHEKLVYCAVGSVLDVLLDLRGGAHYGKTVSVVLSADVPGIVLIPKGVSHGFRALTDDSLMVYKTSTEHAPSHDAGIRWDSFGFDWQCAEPIISKRDLSHPAFEEFRSLF